MLTPWKVTDSAGSDRGAPMFYGDIMGDWREEVVMTSSDYSKLVIFCPTAETDTRLYCLAQNPCYRNCMTAIVSGRIISVYAPKRNAPLSIAVTGYPFISLGMT